MIIIVDSSDGSLGNATINNVIPDKVEFNRNIYQLKGSGPSNGSGSNSSFPGSMGGENKAADPSKTIVNNHNLTHPSITHTNIDEYNLENNIQSVKNFMSPAK